MTTVLGARRQNASPVDKSSNADRPHPEDATVLLPTALPSPVNYKADAVWRFGKYVFRADFDSANLDRVEQGVAGNEFFLQTCRDCGGTANEKATRTWFYFSMCGQSVGDLVVLTILNLNKQSRLYSQDYRPVSWCASQAEWQPLKLRVTYRREGDDFQLRFCHRFENDEETLFAFAIPFSYQQTQDMLDHLDTQLPHATYGTIQPAAASAPDARDVASERSASSLIDAAAPSPTSAAANTPRSVPPEAAATGAAARARPGGEAPADASSPRGARIYYRRQLLTRSIGGRRVEVITITDCSGATGESEPRLPGVMQLDRGPPAATFRDKTVFFISSRVHPGETPATHMFNGMLAFLLRRSDPRAAALRRRFVFKLVPMVNPDGVAVGNYRTDTLGQNLNRFYNGVPDEDTQPSVYAIKTLLMYYAQQGMLEYYIDLHAHANKKGVFIYGNTLEDGDAHLQSLLYAKLVALNNSAFDFIGCNYTEKNMSRPDKDGSSKEGAGRVALYRETGLTHLYTIEANYNAARTLNVVAPAAGDHGGRASPPCNKRFPPKFTVGAFHSVGRAFLVAALDMETANPWSRLPHSEHRNLEGVRSWILTVLRATSETRAAHLPPMSDAAVELLRGMIASGALRVSAPLASGGRTRHRSSSLDSPAISAIGFGSASGMGATPIPVAFGRTVAAGSSSSGRPLPPAPRPARRAHASLPFISGAVHGSPSTPSTSSSGVPPRRGAVAGQLGRTSVDGLTRSTSLPMRSSTPSTARQSPRCSAASKEAAGEAGPAAEAGCVEVEGLDAGIAAADSARVVVEGPSDSDGDEEADEDTLRTGSPASNSPVTPVSARFRNLESPLRSSSVQTYKGAAVYCGRVTEFKFPLADRSVASQDGNGSGLNDSLRGSVSGQFSGGVRSRPPSAGGARRPLSAGGAATASLSAAATTSHSGGGGGRTGSGSPAVSPATTSRHMVLPRPMGTGAAVLVTPEQITGPAGAPKHRSTLSFGRSGSANRKTR